MLAGTPTPPALGLVVPSGRPLGLLLGLTKARTAPYSSAQQPQSLLPNPNQVEASASMGLGFAVFAFLAKGIFSNSDSVDKQLVLHSSILFSIWLADIFLITDLF